MFFFDVLSLCRILGVPLSKKIFQVLTNRFGGACPVQKNLRLVVPLSFEHRGTFSLLDDLLAVDTSAGQGYQMAAWGSQNNLGVHGISW